jgi:hypothetical protein
MSLEHWENDAGKEKPKYLEENVSYRYYFDHIFHMDWAEIEPGSPP